MAKAPRSKASTPLATKISVSLGIVLSMLLGVLVNVFVARHYTRWDVTTGGLYTLSDATLQTLASLEEPVQVYILLPAGDPLTISVTQLLTAYASESSRVDVRVTDPERHTAEFLALQQRFDMAAGRTEDGRVVSEASIVVVRGEKPYFLTSRDLVEVEDEDDMRARPRLEQALTRAIRGVTSGARPLVCFSSGHGEPSLDQGGPSGLAALGDRLTKNNYEVVAIEPLRTSEDKGAIDKCSVFVLAGPSDPVPAEDVASMRAFLDKGGSALLVVGPVPDEKEEGYLDLGVADLLAQAGVATESDFLFELNPAYRSSSGFGETFLPIPKPHAVTDGLIRAADRDRGLAVVVTVASSLRTTGAGPAAPAPLLVTSDDAFGMVDFLGWAKDPVAPEPKAADRRGPLTIAYATELAKKDESATRGPRIAVVSSASVLAGANWQSLELRGTGLFVESAIAWLAAQPSNLDIPNKPTFTAGLRLTDESLAETFRYVVLFMPLAAALLGVAVFLRRKGTERRGTRAKKKAP